MADHDYTSGAPSSTDADDFFSPENRAKRRAAELERIAQIKLGWARMDTRYVPISPKKGGAWDRSIARFERDRIEDQYRRAFRATRWDDAGSCAQWEITDAKHTVALADWREKWGHLWPDIFGPWEPRPGFIYPAGYVERMRAERLEKKITALQVLREAQLILEIHEMRNAA